VCNRTHAFMYRNYICYDPYLKRAFKDVNAYFCHSIYYSLNKKQEYVYVCAYICDAHASP